MATAIHATKTASTGVCTKVLEPLDEGTDGLAVAADDVAEVRDVVRTVLLLLLFLAAVVLVSEGERDGGVVADEL